MPPAFNTRDYFRRTAAVAEPIFSGAAAHELDEQAGPAYFRGLSFSRWIFWKRLAASLGELPESGDACLDFGCGFGMMLPCLAQRFDRVYGVDLMPELSLTFLHHWNEAEPDFPTEVRIEQSVDELGLEPESLDCITALDVLEHIDDLSGLLTVFHRLLKPDGRLIVSGPTENRLYKLGRKIVGFSGDYHVSDIHTIRQQMEESFQVSLARTILPWVPLFHILTAVPKASGESTARLALESHDTCC